MKLLTTSILLSLALLIIFEYTSLVNADAKDDALLQIEEDIYNLVREDTKKDNEKQAKKEVIKKEVRRPCGFAACVRSSSRRRRRSSFWGKKSVISTRSESQKTRSSHVDDKEYDALLQGIGKLVEKLEDNRKRP